MRHQKRTVKLNRNSSHRRCMFANMLKSLITTGRLETTVAKAKILRSQADRLVTLSKRGTLATQRAAIAKLMVTYNTLSPKEAREVKETGNRSAYNSDRQVMGKLGELAQRFVSRPGGYTRIVRIRNRIGDGAPLCVIEYLPS